MKRIFRNFMHTFCWGVLCVLISPFIETTLLYPFLGSRSGWILAEERIGVLVELDPVVCTPEHAVPNHDSLLDRSVRTRT
ncbi:MAG: hypothetical protein RBT80_20725 [Candidatus Vecturithrix sp.]|jgi:hypothetical protein|nr:hypothetical protein [Candidatus Vecturithrix sp.]